MQKLGEKIREKKVRTKEIEEMGGYSIKVEEGRINEVDEEDSGEEWRDRTREEQRNEFDLTLLRIYVNIPQ